MIINANYIKSAITLFKANKMSNKKKHIKRIIVGFFLNLIVIFAWAQNPVPSFNTNQTSGCSPLTIQFTNTSVSALSYYWDFGNGNISVLTDPANVYSNAGTYTVKLIAIAANGQKDSTISSNLITVVSGSLSNFYAVNTSSCLDGNVVSFINTSVNSTNCLWDFGDGFTSTDQNPIHTYLIQGNYAIKLITYDSYGCQNIKVVPNYIHIIPNPSTDFSVNTSIGCNLNQVFQFTSPTTSVNAWLWDFGDGNTSALQNPNHTYNSAGAYTVALKTTNAGGCTNSLSIPDYISAFAAQIPMFTSSITKACLPVEIKFTNQSPNTESLMWNFGDGDSANEENPSHIFQNAGNYTISLTINTFYYCTYTATINNYISIPNNAVPNFSLINPNACAPMNVSFTNQSSGAVSWLWEFGEGDTSIVQSPSHVYTENGSYTVTLHAYNSAGCEAIYQHQDAVILIKPKATFSSNFSPGCAPLTTNFVNTSTGTIQWLWNFGDGTSSTLKNPMHTYNLPGNYDVSLVAFDSHGCSDTLTLNSYIHVINTVGNFIPPATITGCVPFNTTFSNTTQGAVSWHWDFGDGNTSTQQNPSHTYNASGFFTVALTIQLDGGCIQSYPVFRTFDIKGGQGGFTFINQTQCSPFVVDFAGSLSGNLSSCFWDFGDGITSILQNPTHSYANSGFYTVKYTNITSQGCTSTTIETNGIHFNPCPSGGNNGSSEGGNGGWNQGSIAYSLPPQNGCVPFMVHFNNTLSQTVSWLWNFGDGNTSNLQNPIHNYTTSGNYDVTLIAQNSSGQNDTVIYSSYIHASAINTDFSFTENSDCINTTLTCTGISSNAVQWYWDFDNGNTSILQNPINTFPDSINNYTITLTTENANGCSGSLSKNMLKTAYNGAIWASNNEVCINQPVSFNCASSNFISYLWNFGDGTTSSLPNPEHSYLIGGIYQVELILTENNGCTHHSSLQNLISVENPIANFSSALANGCNSQTVNFTNLSAGTSVPLANHCKWNFGDGSAEQWAENPTHIYSIPGNYLVTLTVNHLNNCFNSITKTIHVHPIAANFSFTQNTSCFPITVSFIDSSTTTTVSWLWDFGDGTTSSLQNPIHTFAIAPQGDVTLSVSDANGCQGTITKPNITFFYTDFWVSAADVCTSTDVQFFDASSNAGQWQWDFGDGNTSTLQNPTHAYQNNGSYTVTLISNSIEGCIDTAIFSSINSSKPTADFSSPNHANCSPTLVSFTDLSINATSWLWDFGDGSSSLNQYPTHVYNVPGLYTIKLIVTNVLGCSDTLIRINYIEILGPVANFTASANQPCLESVIQFTDFSSNAISWNWNFGDGNISSLQNPSNTYQNTGQYTVSLIVKDSHGCKSNFALVNPITVHPLPTAGFTASDTISCTPFAVSFHNNSQNAISYLWDFGDGNTSTLQDPSHAYLNFGTYSVSMVATNQFGCSDTKLFNSIIANKTPVVNFSANNSGGCSPLNIAFTDSSTNIQNANYFWNFGNGITSSQQNPSAVFINPGLYSISLLITNSTGCKDSLVKTAFIEVYDFNPPEESTIKVVTVISDNSTSLSWNKSLANDFSYYKIYRNDLATGNYFPIGTINNSSETTFLDANNVNTLFDSYCYKVQTVDICGYALPLDSLHEHCTINVTAKGINDNVLVNWTPYIGADVGSYSIFRKEIADADDFLIAIVPSNILTITDTTLACPINFSYRIKANNLNGNSVFSNSDTSVAKPPYHGLANQQVDIVRSTVINNTQVLTEWNAPVISPEKVTGYKIYRSTDNIHFSLLTNVLSSVHEYIDEDVDVNTQNYYYKIKVANSCGIGSLESNKSSSIFLKAELINGNVNLNWTSYDGWNTGVDHYMIEKMNKQGVWEIIKTVDGNKLIYEDDN